MCLSPNCLMPESQVYAQIRNIQLNLGKGATLVPSTVKLLHRRKERKNQWELRGLQAWPETGS